MAKKLWASVRAAITMENERHQRDLLVYARTEYKTDWRYAYNYMLHNNGKGPSYGAKN